VTRTHVLVEVELTEQEYARLRPGLTGRGRSGDALRLAAGLPERPYGYTDAEVLAEQQYLDRRDRKVKQ
jgi:hypothetical protein